MQCDEETPIIVTFGVLVLMVLVSCGTYWIVKYREDRRYEKLLLLEKDLTNYNI